MRNFWIVAVVLAAGLCGTASAQRRATEKEAGGYIHSAFLTQADPGVMSHSMALGPELEQRLGLPTGSEGVKVYRALIAAAGDSAIEVRRTTPEEIAAYGLRRGFDPKLPHPLYTLVAGNQRFLLQYDLQATRIPFVGQLGVPDPEPLVVTKPVAAPPPAVLTAAAWHETPHLAIGRPGVPKLVWTGRFETNSATLTPEARATLDAEFISKVAGSSDLRFIVSGHADRLGSGQYNRNLSEQRAEAVRAHLVARGIGAEKIAVFGYGSTIPARACPEEKALSALRECLEPNRRVVVDVLRVTP